MEIIDISNKEKPIILLTKHEVSLLLKVLKKEKPGSREQKQIYKLTNEFEILRSKIGSANFVDPNLPKGV